MYREADGADDVRRAAREQLRHGADFVKVMTTGARSVELEDPDPAQMTREEVATVVEEAHRLGYRVAAHAEGLAGTEIAIETGVDTIEHGMYLNQRPDLLERMAEQGQVLVPTLSCFYGVAGLDDDDGQAAGAWSPLLVELAQHNLEQADRTLTAAHGAGVQIALGHDWNPFYESARELERLVHHGLPAMDALVAATATGASALGLGGGADGSGGRARHARAGQAGRPGDRRRRPALRSGGAATARARLASPTAGRGGRRRRARSGPVRRRVMQLRLRMPQP
jgi:imidazolonepropionase-like amidohydrolase